MRSTHYAASALLHYATVLALLLVLVLIPVPGNLIFPILQIALALLLPLWLLVLVVVGGALVVGEVALVVVVVMLLVVVVDVAVGSISSSRGSDVDYSDVQRYSSVQQCLAKPSNIWLHLTRHIQLCLYHKAI